MRKGDPVGHVRQAFHGEYRQSPVAVIRQRASDFLPFRFFLNDRTQPYPGHPMMFAVDYLLEAPSERRVAREKRSRDEMEAAQIGRAHV